MGVVSVAKIVSVVNIVSVVSVVSVLSVVNREFLGVVSVVSSKVL